MTYGPIYLAGADRSGTTLMSALLASHPHIAIAALGSNMWTFFNGKYGDLRDDKNFERALAALFEYKNVLLLQPDAERIRREFFADERTYARLFRLLQDHFAERMGKPRWGDKTSYVERYADTILNAYPDAQMIHMLRDPRDRYASAIKRWPNGKGQVGGATARWLYSVRLAERNLAKYPTRYLVVRYESLVSQPEETMQRVCAFLHEPYDPVMFTMSGAQNFWNRGGNSSFERLQPGAISTAAVGRYRRALSPREIAFIQLFAGAVMRAYGYEVEQNGFSAREKISFYGAYVPINSLRLVGWQVLEMLQQHFPEQVGRAPMQDRLVLDAGSKRA